VRPRCGAVLSPSCRSVPANGTRQRHAAARFAELPIRAGERRAAASTARVQ
jgi:hypothetical protein